MQLHGVMRALNCPYLILQSSHWPQDLLRLIAVDHGRTSNDDIFSCILNFVLHNIIQYI